MSTGSLLLFCFVSCLFCCAVVHMHFLNCARNAVICHMWQHDPGVMLFDHMVYLFNKSLLNFIWWNDLMNCSWWFYGQMLSRSHLVFCGVSYQICQAGLCGWVGTWHAMNSSLHNKRYHMNLNLGLTLKWLVQCAHLKRQTQLHNRSEMSRGMDWMAILGISHNINTAVLNNRCVE